MQNITWIPSLAGGALIGTAAALLLWSSGRVAGVSGIAGGILAPKAGEIAWRIVFILGLMVGAAIAALLWTKPVVASGGAVSVLTIVAGLLVGVGTALANGCTSGHGVCGLARFSLRSLVAVISFLSAGIVTITLLRHVWGVQV